MSATAASASASSNPTTTTTPATVTTPSSPSSSSLSNLTHEQILSQLLMSEGEESSTKNNVATSSASSSPKKKRIRVKTPETTGLSPNFFNQQPTTTSRRQRPHPPFFSNSLPPKSPLTFYPEDYEYEYQTGEDYEEEDDEEEEFEDEDEEEDCESHHHQEAGAMSPYEDELDFLLSGAEYPSHHHHHHQYDQHLLPSPANAAVAAGITSAGGNLISKQISFTPQTLGTGLSASSASSAAAAAAKDVSLEGTSGVAGASAQLHSKPPLHYPRRRSESGLRQTLQSYHNNQMDGKQQFFRSIDNFMNADSRRSSTTWSDISRRTSVDSASLFGRMTPVHNMSGSEYDESVTEDEAMFSPFSSASHHHANHFSMTSPNVHNNWSDTTAFQNPLQDDLVAHIATKQYYSRPSIIHNQQHQQHHNNHHHHQQQQGSNAANSGRATPISVNTNLSTAHVNMSYASSGVVSNEEHSLSTFPISLERIPTIVYSQFLKSKFGKDPHLKEQFLKYIHKREVQEFIEEENQRNIQSRMLFIKSKVKDVCIKIRDKLYIDCYENDADDWDSQIPNLTQQLIILLDECIIKYIQYHFDSYHDTMTLMQTFIHQFRKYFLDTNQKNNMANQIIETEAKIEAYFYNLLNHIFVQNSYPQGGSTTTTTATTNSSSNGGSAAPSSPSVYNDKYFFEKIMIDYDKHGLLEFHKEELKEYQKNYFVMKVIMFVNDMIENNTINKQHIERQVQILVKICNVEHKQQVTNILTNEIEKLREDPHFNYFETKILILNELQEFDKIMEQVEQQQSSGFIRKYILEQSKSKISNTSLVVNRPQYVIQRAKRELSSQLYWMLKTSIFRLTSSVTLKTALLSTAPEQLFEEGSSYLSLLILDLNAEMLNYPPLSFYLPKVKAVTVSPSTAIINPAMTPRQTHKRERSASSTLSMEDMNTLLHNLNSNDDTSAADKKDTCHYSSKRHHTSIDFTKDDRERPTLSYKLGIEGHLFLAMQAFESMGESYFEKPKYEQFCKDLAFETRLKLENETNFSTCSKEEAIYIYEKVLPIFSEFDALPPNAEMWIDLFDISNHLAANNLHTYYSG